jgi:hypothetical protein
MIKITSDTLSELTGLNRQSILNETSQLGVTFKPKTYIEYVDAITYCHTKVMDAFNRLKASGKLDGIRDIEV